MRGLAMVFLAEPSAKYKESFLEGLREFQEEGTLLQYNLPRLTADFDDYLRQVNRVYNRASMPPYFVPDTRYWLIEGDEEKEEGVYVGNLTVRHELNELLLKVGGHIGYQIRPSWRRQGYGREILRLGLQKARALGITRALVTCDETNIASKKVIEYNGGQFENAVYVEGSAVKKLRYWIDIV